MANAPPTGPPADLSFEDPADYLVDETGTCAILGGKEKPIHRSTLWRGIESGRYPPPIKIGPNTNRWDRRKVAKVVESAASVATVAATSEE